MSVLKDYLPLLGGVQPKRITYMAFVVSDSMNQRELSGERAAKCVAALQSFKGRFINSDHIQPYTWDFEKWVARRYTPLVFNIVVSESWQENQERRGLNIVVPIQHITGLSVYDVEDYGYEARQWQGSRYENAAYHTNSIQLPRPTVQQMIDVLYDILLGEEPNDN